MASRAKPGGGSSDEPADPRDAGQAREPAAASGKDASTDVLKTGGALGGRLFEALAQDLGGDRDPGRGGAASPAGEADPLLGQTVRHYRVIERLGAGGMAVVYRALDLRLSRPVALKFLPADLAQDAHALERFVREARAVSALNHPNICVLHEIGEHQGRPYLVLELLEGQTLELLVRAGPMEPARALAIASDVAEGLAAAHEAGIVHRDIKPANLLITRRGHVKILDFGIAKLLPPDAGSDGLTSAPTRHSGEALTQPGTNPGTFAYMSPEQLRGQELDGRSDLFSLGAVLYEMLSGRRAFGGTTPGVIIAAILLQQPDSLRDDGHSARHQELLDRLLGKEPDQRYASAAELRDALEGLRLELLATSQPGPWPPAAPAPRTPSTLTGEARPRRSVGRQKELLELRRAWESCRSGSGAIVCISGEPGIGKSSLIEDFLAELAPAATQSLIARGRCSERLAGAEAYLPVLEALESLWHGEARELVARLMKETAPTWYVQLAPVLAATDPTLAEVMAEAKVASRERMKREFHNLVHELSRHRPLVLFYDDLHWADVSTVDLLSYVGSRCAAMPLLILGTYRPSDLLLSQHPFLEVQRELKSRGLCREIALDPLSAADVASYLDTEFPKNDFPPFFRTLIHARTEGHPLFLTDLLRDLRARSAVEQREGTWVLAQSVSEIQHDLPESTRGMIDRKIARLDDADRRLLAAAAVQGHGFDSLTLAQATGGDVDSVEGRLETLGSLHRFVRPLEERELPDGSMTHGYRFEHGLYQNALYATLRPRERSRLSAAVAEALLGLHGEKGTAIASDLAYLFEAGRRFERAADHFLLAAQHAASVHGNHEAILLARQAIANAKKLERKDRLPRVLAAAIHLGQLHLALSEMELAISDYELAEATAAELGDVEAQVNAICAAALVHFNLRRVEKTREEATRALTIARAAGSEVAVASAEVILGLEHLCFGDTEQAHESFQRSVPILEREGPPLHALESIGFAGLQYAWQLDYQEADRAVGWTLNHAREVGSPYHIIMNLFVRGMSFFNQGRLSEGLVDLRQGMRLAEQTEERYWLSRFPNTLGWAYRELQDFDAALRWNLEGAEVARENGYGKPEANSHVNLAQFYLEVGELERAGEHLVRAEQIFEEDLWFKWRYNIRLKAEWARYWMRRGDPQQAGRHAAESLLLAEPRKARKHMSWAHKLLADVAVMEERFDDARREYEAALGVLSGHRCPTIEWRILLAAAEMASASRDTSRAEHYRGRCQSVIHALADSLADDPLRRQFLQSEAIRAALL